MYKSDIAFNASFDLAGVPAFAPDGAVLDWNRAEFLVGATVARGAQADATITAGEKLQTLAPAAALRSVTVKLQPGGETQLTLFGARAAELAQPNVKFEVTASPGRNGWRFSPSEKPQMSTSKETGRTPVLMVAICRSLRR